ncbi:MAG: hypothetical protein JRH05_14025, partial [Deltaproteobacteria bacterium]|nr:hypothetical protein [Deltaproteobacteria bacterium]MBW1950976.1 hypothetical protein [Deltaproteobacteria bacterium]MBW2009085.1 hypothetical protein [Deltaproteobacteria bacterium]MBW2103746.1 hypothetical protein [Deltaproteobacteria bacterium]
EEFEWLSSRFSDSTTLMDVPQDILDRLASVDISRRGYGGDRNSVTAIALITFAYRMTHRIPEARHGPKEILLLKVLARAEAQRRKGERDLENPCWRVPLVELITGAVGERVRAMRVMNAPD